MFVSCIVFIKYDPKKQFTNFVHINITQNQPKIMVISNFVMRKQNITYLWLKELILMKSNTKSVKICFSIQYSSNASTQNTNLSEKLESNSKQTPITNNTASTETKSPFSSAFSSHCSRYHTVDSKWNRVWRGRMELGLWKVDVWNWARRLPH